MDKSSVIGSVSITASPEKVWETLTDPAKVVQYLGSHVHSDWKEGSMITWDGEMQGRKYQNKGKVLENKFPSLLKFTYWSGMGGDPDEPHNYSVITYKLQSSEEGKTDLIYSREKIPTEMEKEMFESYLNPMLMEVKKITESA